MAAPGKRLLLLLIVAAAAAAQQVTAIRTSALAFLKTLGAPARAKAVLVFESSERSNWGYTPRSRKGLPVGEMTPAQHAALNSLLRSSLSAKGLAKTNGVIELEPILGVIEGNSRRDPARYYFSIFGDPAGSPWGWRFEGHHLSLNFTFLDDRVAPTPAFIGANPARVPSGARKGWRVLAAEEDLGRRLVTALSADQRKRAMIAGRAPSDIVTGNDRRVSLTEFEGLPVSTMTAEQRELLLALIHTYVGNSNAAIAATEMEKINRAGLQHLFFGWAGGVKPGEPHYYRIHGPTILIEYDNTQDGANRIHSVWRSPTNDFGEDLL